MTIWLLLIICKQQYFETLTSIDIVVNKLCIYEIWWILAKLFHAILDMLPLQSCFDIKQNISISFVNWSY